MRCRDSKSSKRKVLCVWCSLAAVSLLILSCWGCVSGRGSRIKDDSSSEGITKTDLAALRRSCRFVVERVANAAVAANAWRNAKDLEDFSTLSRKSLLQSRPDLASLLDFQTEDVSVKDQRPVHVLNHYEGVVQLDIAGWCINNGSHSVEVNQRYSVGTDGDGFLDRITERLIDCRRRQEAETPGG